MYVNVGCHPDVDAARALVAGSVAAFAHFSAMPGSAGAGLSEADREVVAEVGRRYDSNHHLDNTAEHTGALRPEFVDRFAIVGPPAAWSTACSRCTRSVWTASWSPVRASDPIVTTPAPPARSSPRKCCRPCARRELTMAEHDLVVRGGTVIDGTGLPARTADVAVRDGVVTEVGRVTGTATREIDAVGLLVTPGFVDVHTHYDGQASWGQRMIPSAWHGVTTVVTGNCGVGFAPVRPADHVRLIELMEGVEDIPGTVLHEGLAWSWQTFGEFMDVLDGRTFDVDVAVQVPHGALRLHVMGERGARRDPATPDDIDTMAAMARDAIEQGALGFTTSRTLNHRTSRGELTPTLTASADELVGIARAIGGTGRGVLQVVSDFADVDAEFALLRRMAEESNRPLSFSLVQTRGDGWRRQLALLSDATAAGVDMRAQVAPRAVGLLLGLQCTLHPLLTNAAYRDVAELPLAERVAILEQPSFQRPRPRGPRDRRARCPARRAAAARVRPHVRAGRASGLRARPGVERRGARRA